MKHIIAISMKTLKIKRSIIVMFALTLMVNHIKSQTNFYWGKQFGSDKDEYAMNHLVDNDGNVFIAGNTNGILNSKNYGKTDGFITKIDSLGNTIWTRQFGSEGEEDIQWSAIDDTGCIYITGSTTGILKDKNTGEEDLFIIKYNQLGEIEWEKQFGTDSTDIAKGIYADDKGYIYVTGVTSGKLGQNSFGKSDCFIMKLNSKGTHLITLQFGTPFDDIGYAITGGPDSDIFVCGVTWGDLAVENKGVFDGFTGHFTEKLDLIRYDQFGSAGFDIPMAIYVDNEKNIYVGGSTSEDFGCKQIGEGDCFLLKISKKGEVFWNNQFGTKYNDGVRSIDFNSNISDNIIVSGIMNLPPSQGFIRMYRRDGIMLWERKFIAKGKDIATSGKDVGVDNKGNIYHMGLTGANMFNTLIGGSDIYLVKLGLDTNFLKH